ncbi:flagellar biosynthetic protein FliO [Endozoicomonas arenosclerae]|uniref:flagellar biosynthetic protein FliO n=1 Tax=Endozoicomonas arenosclerae TaxID=1633495 RepID=UPI000781D2BC|nr:flagellar biosynthetic protein FliO [Endozoicomonas arenosclerae]
MRNVSLPPHLKSFLIKVWLACLTGFTTAAVAEAEPEKAADLSLTQVIAPLFFVILLIFALAWIVKKLNIGTPAIGQGIKVISSIPVSSQARVCLIRVGEKDILLGVTNQQVNLIQTFDESPIPPDNKENQHDFADQFRSLLKGRNSK